MRLFNFFFNHSKQEQDKPIRDKIKNKNHFEKLLSEEKEVIKQRNEIISKVIRMILIHIFIMQ